MDPAAILPEGLTYAERALDHLSATGRADLTTIDAADMHIVWFISKANGKQTIRVTSTGVVRPSISASGVADSRGNPLRPSPAPPAIWHESMRYWRRSQVTDDVFEATRSLWLAFENLLDDYCPINRGEREGQWIRRGFRMLSSDLDLQNYLPATTGALEKAAHDYFYDDVRTDLFHAKASRNPILPHDPGSNMYERHERLTRLYLDLLSKHVSVTRMSGGLTLAAFQAMVTAMFPGGASISVSDDPSPFDPTDATINPAGGEVVAGSTATVDAGEPSGARHVVRGQVDVPKLKSLSGVRRIGMMHGSDVAAVEVLDGDLQVAGAMTLEGEMAFRMENVQQPKQFIKTL